MTRFPTATTHPADASVAATDRPASSPRGSRGRRRAQRVIAATALLGGVSTALVTMATAANADISTNNGGYAWETVRCEPSTHQVTITIDARGEDSGQIGGGELDPGEIVEPVYVRIWGFTGGAWHDFGSPTLDQYGRTPTQVTVTMAGSSYWYFQYGFKTPEDTFDNYAEWSQGVLPHGAYQSGGYYALPVCNS